MLTRFHALCSRLAIVAAVLLLTSCTYQYSFDEPEFRGKVVDDTTGKPLSGAIVAAYWGVQDGNLAGNSWVAEYVHFFEGTTDDKGEFIIPAWSERKLVKGKIADQFPSVLVYKSGYRLAQWQGTSVKNWPPRPLLLKPANDEASKRETMHALKYWFRGGDGSGGADCAWSHLTKLFIEQRRQIVADHRAQMTLAGKPFTPLAPGKYDSLLDSQYRGMIDGWGAGGKAGCPDPLTFIRMSEG